MDLHALRLNCRLAALVPTALGLLALGLLDHLHQAQVAEADRLATRDLVSAWAALPHPLDGPAGDPAWTAALMHLEGDRLVTDAGHATGLPQEPTPELLDVVRGPQAWHQGPDLFAVARLPVTAGPSRLLVVRRPLQPADRGPVLVAGGLLAVIGLALGWYLARRIHRPVEALTQAAEAALEGRPEPDVVSASDETEVLRSSVLRLAERYRSSSHHAPRG